ncbi:MAG TPA: helix-turn-helix domain-containing protein [Patescibacteria group bacterium]|nr:helix-turn-helix domain-containing protein [Patescibacteria group bacterium]
MSIYSKPKSDFTLIPNWVIRNRKIPDCVFRVYVDIKSYAYGHHKAFPSQQRLANDLGKRRETINHHTTWLEKHKFILKRRRGYSQTNIYDFCDETITFSKDKGDKNIIRTVTNSLYQLLETSNSKNTNKNTKNNEGLELLRKRVNDLNLRSLSTSGGRI